MTDTILKNLGDIRDAAEQKRDDAQQEFAEAHTEYMNAYQSKFDEKHIELQKTRLYALQERMDMIQKLVSSEKTDKQVRQELMDYFFNQPFKEGAE